MKSRTSFINRGVLLNDFKRFGWIGAGYLLVLLLSVPLKVFMLYSRLEEAGVYYGIDYVNPYSRIFQFDPSQSFLHVVSLILVPVLTGLLLFRYLQDSRAADMTHSLPVRRETLYNTHLAAGILLLSVPLVLTALVAWALVAGLGIELTGTNIFCWLSISLLFSLLFFMTSAAVGMITGMTTLQGVLSYILLLLPSGLSLLLLNNINYYIYGFAYEYYADKIVKLSPLIRLTEMSGDPIRSGEIIIYLLCGIALYFAGRYLYRRRPLETAGNAITFDILRPIFKYGVTFCFMLLLGSYFNSVQGGLGWTYFGYFLGSILAYFLTEILLNKSLQVFQRRQVRGYGIYALAMVALVGLSHYDFTGYEKRLPELSKVKSVYMDQSFHALNYVPTANALAYGGSEYNLPVKAIFTEKDNVAGIYALHQQIVANRLAEKESFLSNNRTKSYAEWISLAYELENGGRICRRYVIAAPEYADSLKPIYESREYKELHNSILRIDPAEMDLIAIQTDTLGKNVRIADPELIAQAVEVLRRDVYDETYEEMAAMKQKNPWAHISVLLKNNRNVGLDWKKSYTHFEQWLKETGRYNQARLLPGEDVLSAIVDRMPALDPDPQYPDRPRAAPIREEPFSELEKKPGVLKITEPEKLELCLRNYNVSSEQAAYRVVFLLNNGGNFYGFFPELEAPAFVKEHFGPLK